MNRSLLFVLLVFLFVSCNKKKKSLRQLDGEWEITSYQESIFDGTTNFYDLIEGSANFETSKKSTEGRMKISWKAVFENDTTSFDFNGNFSQKALRELVLTSTADTMDCKISRQLKKNMTLKVTVNPDRRTLIHLKKK